MHKISYYVKTSYSTTIVGRQKPNTAAGISDHVKSIAC